MRTKNAVPRLRAKRRLLKRVKGSVGGRRRLLRTAKESIIRAGVFAKRDRRRRKRDFRRLWIIRINAACRAMGMKYSEDDDEIKKEGMKKDKDSMEEGHGEMYDEDSMDEEINLDETFGLINTE